MADRRGPTGAAGLAAGRETAPVLAADAERRLLQTGNDHHAVRPLQQILGNSLLRDGHNLLKDRRRVLQPLLSGFGHQHRRERNGGQ